MIAQSLLRRLEEGGLPGRVPREGVDHLRHLERAVAGAIAASVPLVGALGAGFALPLEGALGTGSRTAFAFQADGAACGPIAPVADRYYCAGAPALLQGDNPGTAFTATATVPRPTGPPR